MAFSFSFSYLVLVLVICLGRSIAQEDTTHEGCIHMPIIHLTNTQYFEKRAVSLSLTNRSDIAYYAQLNIGNPAQPVFVQLDTGSFELWVNPQCANLDVNDARFCQTVGQYDTTQSSTSVSLGTSKTLRYGIGSANISYFTDDIALPGSTTTLRDVQFGVATSTGEEFSGIMGIGYGQGIATRYRNFVDELSAQNATKVKAFTVALGNKDDQEGIIVFGGVDTSRFSGTLARLPIIPAAQSPDQVPRYWVNMQSLSLTPPSGKTRSYSNSSIPVFLDTGATMTLLPADLAQAVAKDFGSTGADANGFYEVSCDLENVNGTLDFAFDGTTIRVPYREIIRYVAGSPPTCFLGISPSDSFTLLGDTFMRSAYAVFDLDNNLIWMTQAANCGSTPAALSSMSVMSTLTGACNVNRAVTSGDTGSTSGTGEAASSSGTASTRPHYALHARCDSTRRDLATTLAAVLLNI
ncbi:acid protease [Coniochaeta ligniaria NRRL 30616]|uniref:Acid protease n=1 Tax=Coniochaeta ligniaria NRRL 30616 TaxID=1408157 RepID=A0A1J7I565_9PEZI|nr:acid protease [Coniochaeta ligniaria NRRL 30616]